MKRLSAGWVVVAVVALGFGAWFLVRMKDAMQTQKALAAERTQAAKEAEKPHAKTTTAKLVNGLPGKWRPSIALEGTLQPSREADLGFKLPGRLGSIRVKMGDKVHSGATLATLEDNEARAQVQAAEAQVRAAEAQLALADDGARRMNTLAGKGAATEALGVQSGQQKQLAQAQLDGARAQLMLAQTNLKNHALTAPFSGSVTRVPSGPGAIVNPGVPLFHVSDLSTLKLVATVSEGDAALVKPGAAVSLEVNGKPHGGTVTAVLSSVDSATRRVPVEARIENPPDAPLLGGSFVRAELIGGSEIAILKLPANALRPGSQNEVMVARAGRLERRRITFSTDQGSLYVRHGLSADEKVLLSPSPEAQDGDPVAMNQ
jgi:RND family efflux transporter MFP subunit